MSPGTPARRSLALLLVGLPCLALAALGPRYGGDLVVGLPDLPSTLAPVRPMTLGDSVTQELVHATLVTLRDGQLQPGLARNWTGGPRDWVFELAPDACFHDETPLRAHEVVESLRRFIKSPSPAAAYLALRLRGGAAFRDGRSNDVPGLAALDPWHVQLSLTNPDPNALAALTSPAAAVTSSLGSGAGPFIPVHIVPERRISLAAFASHWQGRPYLDRLRLVALAQQEDLARAFERREVAVALGIGASFHPGPRLILVLVPHAPPFDRRETRRLVDRALDRSFFAARVLTGSQPLSRLFPGGGEALALPAAIGAQAPLSGSIELAVASNVPPRASQRIVALLTDLGATVSPSVYPASRSPSPRAQARLSCWFPEVDDPALTVNELLLLTGRPPLEPAASDSASLRKAERGLLAEGLLLPIVELPVSMSWDASVMDLRSGGRTSPALSSLWLAAPSGEGSREDR